MALTESVPEQSLEPRIGRSVSLDDAAQLLGASRRTICNRIREGRLQTIRTPGGSQRVLSGHRKFSELKALQERFA